MRVTVKTRSDITGGVTYYLSTCYGPCRRTIIAVDGIPVSGIITHWRRQWWRRTPPLGVVGVQSQS